MFLFHYVLVCACLVFQSQCMRNGFQAQAVGQCSSGLLHVFCCSYCFAHRWSIILVSVVRCQFSSCLWFQPDARVKTMASVVLRNSDDELMHAASDVWLPFAPTMGAKYWVLIRRFTDVVLLVGFSLLNWVRHLEFEQFLKIYIHLEFFPLPVRSGRRVKVDMCKPIWYPWVHFSLNAYMFVYLGSSVDPHGALVDVGCPLRRPPVAIWVKRVQSWEMCRNLCYVHWYVMWYACTFSTSLPHSHCPLDHI